MMQYYINKYYIGIIYILLNRLYILLNRNWRKNCPLKGQNKSHVKSYNNTIQ